MNKESTKKLKTFLPQLIDIRRNLHTYPELAFQEYETTKYIKKIIESWGLEFIQFQNIDTGGYCEIGEGDIYCFRSDIDALSIEENQDHKIRSKNAGVMHACGHDFHTAIGLGLLKYFQECQNELRGKLRVIFQPGEEAAPGGAEKIIKEKIWDNVLGILTVHVDSPLDVGKIILFDGPVQASSTSISIELSGQGGHTSRPNETDDLINIAGNYIVQIQNYIKQKIDSQETVVLAFGYIKGGNTHNVIPQNIQIRGTLRTLDNNILKKSQNLFRNFTKSFEKLYGIKINLNFPTSCPATTNDKELNKKFMEFMGSIDATQEVLLPTKPSMGADDFAFYLDKAPGLYLGIGGAGKGKFHSGDLLLNEDLIEPAIKYISEFIFYLFKNS